MVRTVNVLCLCCGGDFFERMDKKVMCGMHQWSAPGKMKCGLLFLFFVGVSDSKGERNVWKNSATIGHTLGKEFEAFPF